MSNDFLNDLLLMRRQYTHRLEEVAHQWGLTRAELDILLFLSQDSRLDRAADIVELRGLTKSHVSIAVKDLCERGLLEVRQDEQDRRVTHLKPTAAAEAAIAAGKEAHRRHFEKLFGCFTQEELQQWQQLQEKLFANMKNMED